MNNQLEVDYLQNVKLKDRTLVTYHGHELEECPVPTKSNSPSMQRNSRYSAISMRDASRRPLPTSSRINWNSITPICIRIRRANAAKPCMSSKIDSTKSSMICVLTIQPSLHTKTALAPQRHAKLHARDSHSSNLPARNSSSTSTKRKLSARPSRMMRLRQSHASSGR